jgi:hypothetical protein
MEMCSLIPGKRVLLRREFCPIFIIYFGQNKKVFYMGSVGNKIENNIKRQRRGKLLFASDFAANVSQKELNSDIQLMPIWVRKILLLS